nr:immunoglobulin light chain junction region [Macaca mulatta]MOW60222.1 immunoglobulin light chain junction region [Macaca mulatta]
DYYCQSTDSSLIPLF